MQGGRSLTLRGPAIRAGKLVPFRRPARPQNYTLQLQPLATLFYLVQRGAPKTAGP